MENQSVAPIIRRRTYNSKITVAYIVVLHPKSFRLRKRENNCERITFQ